MMTLEQFRMTRREVANLADEIDGYDEYGDCPTGGYVYAYGGENFSGGLYYIEKTAEGRVYLILGNRDWLRDASELPALEEILFDYAHSEETA